MSALSSWPMPFAVSTSTTQVEGNVTISALHEGCPARMVSVEDWDSCELLRLWQALPQDVRPERCTAVAHSSDLERAAPTPTFQLPPHYRMNSSVEHKIDPHDQFDWTWMGLRVGQWWDFLLMHSPECTDPECMSCVNPWQPPTRMDIHGENHFAFPSERDFQARLRKCGGWAPDPRTGRWKRIQGPGSPDVECLGPIPSPQGPDRHRKVHTSDVSNADQEFHEGCSTDGQSTTNKKRRGDSASIINMCLSSAKLSGAVVQHCKSHILALTHSHRTYKIGLTWSPEHRWSHKEWGYHKDGKYNSMDILAQTSTAEGAAFLEATLIGQFRNTTGCMNVASGGEGLRTGTGIEGPYYVYVVHGPFCGARVT